jgi:uncharacterized protein YkwD
MDGGNMLSLNGIDCLILIVLIFYAHEGYASGFFRALLDLISFIFSFFIGLRFYGTIAGILSNMFSLPQGFSDALGFFIIAFIVEIVIGILIRTFLSFSLSSPKRLNKIFGILPGILSGAILVAFLLILVIALPISTPIKKAVSSSRIGNFLLSKTQGWEGQLKSVFGDAINETINFLTVEPKGDQSISLNYKAKNVSPDSEAEQDMFKLINKERVPRGLSKFIFDDGLRDVGRRHCQDMFERGYFSHYTPEGLSAFGRMDEAGIIYNAAGENLALSPNVDIAMQGLMNSPGHKANMLSVNFGKVGVGVIDGGIYGEMFCQEFTD